MRLTNHVEWALHAAAALASLPQGKRLSAKSLADLYELPPKYLAKALQALAAAGIVSTTTGPRGGYALAKSPDQISLLDIVQAVQGADLLFHCTEIRRKGPCRALAAKNFSPLCGIAAAMHKADAAWRRELASTSLASLTHAFAQSASPPVLNVLESWTSTHAA